MILEEFDVQIMRKCKKRLKHATFQTIYDDNRIIPFLFVLFYALEIDNSRSGRKTYIKSCWKSFCLFNMSYEQQKISLYVKMCGNVFNFTLLMTVLSLISLIFISFPLDKCL